MHNVFKGIVVGVLGFFVWFLASIPLGISDAFGGAQDPTFYTIMVLGFLIMVGGPVVYVVVLPVAGWVKRRRARREVRSSPSSP